MKRMTETEKWRDPWFRRLPPTFKIGYLYLLDSVDGAGVLELDAELAAFQIGTLVDWEKLRDAMGERLEVLPSGKWWLTKFVRFQNGELKNDCRPHQFVKRLLENHGIGYPRGIYTPKDKTSTGTGKEQDKDETLQGPPKGGLNGRLKQRAGAVFLREVGGVLRERLVDLCVLMRRRGTTVWTAREMQEVAALRVAEMAEEEWREDVWTLWRYYREQKAGGENDYRRRAVGTLLGNWSDDVGKCRQRMEAMETDRGFVEERDRFARGEWDERRLRVLSEV